MKPTYEQIASALFGISSYRVAEDGLHPYRFSERQFAEYAAKWDYYPPRARDSAGISLRFLTDSEHLSLRLSFIPDDDWWYAVIAEVFIDGERVGEVGSPDTPAPFFEKTFPMGAGNHRVEVFFPWSAESVISSLSLDDGASFTPVEKPFTYLQFGDSITHGMDAPKPTKSYAARVAKALGANAINHGVGNDTYFPALPEYEGEVGLISVAYGTNDWSRNEGRAALEETVKAFYRNLNALYPDVPTVAITPLPRGDMETEKNGVPFSAIEEIIREATKPYLNVTVVSGLSLVPNDPSLFRSDRLHPIEEGFAVYADNLLPILKAALESRK